MLNPKNRLFAPGGEIYPDGPSIWHIVDWDQRRWISVTMDEELESEDPACEHLLKHIDDLPPDVYGIHVSSEGELISTSSDPKDDPTLCVYYPPVNTTERPNNVQVVSRVDLKELDRLGPNVDLVVCSGSEPTKKVRQHPEHVVSPERNKSLGRLQVLLLVSKDDLRVARNELVDASAQTPEYSAF